MFTGQLPSESGTYAGNQELPTNSITLPERLQKAGYSTFATSAGAHIRSDRGYNRGFDVFKETYRFSLSPESVTTLFRDNSYRQQAKFSLIAGPDKKTLYKFESLKSWIKETTKPFFGFINAKTAHHPYNPPRAYKSQFCPFLDRPRYQFIEELFGNEFGEKQSVPGMDMDRLQKMSYRSPLLGGEFKPTSEEWDIIKRWYDGAIRYLDSRIEDLIGFLKDYGQLENTYLIITADHGEYFGEHGLEKHYYGLYEPVVHVPLVVRAPNTKATIHSPVSLIDLYPTITELAGADSGQNTSATSLGDFEDRQYHNYVFAELGAKPREGIRRHYPNFDPKGLETPTQTVRNEEYKYIHNYDDEDELYQWRSDPAESKDVINTETDVAKELETVLHNRLSELKHDPLNEEISDPALEQQLEDLGYL
jgi:arylsulfatase A-like enzyme